METNEIIEKLTADIKAITNDFVIEYDKLVYVLIDDDQVDVSEGIQELNETYLAFEEFLETLKTKAQQLEDTLTELRH